MIFFPEKIIVHHSLTADSKTVSWGAIRRYHTETLGWLNIGYHFGIECARDQYEVFCGRMLTETGAHCRGRNTDSIGICLIGNFDDRPPPAEQWDLAVKLCRSLIQVFELSWRDVYGHRDFAGYKTCPGDAFDMDRFRIECAI